MFSSHMWLVAAIFDSTYRMFPSLYKVPLDRALESAALESDCGDGSERVLILGQLRVAGRKAEA